MARALPASDLLVVGGGPAGLAVAIAARAEGLTVNLVDRAQPPIDKACGEGLMPDGLSCLRRLGVELPPGQGHPFRGIRYLDSGRVAEGRFPGQAHGLGIRRTVLQEAMAERAKKVGVRLFWRRKALGLDFLPDGVRLDTEDGPLHASFLVGADGLRSRVRGWAGIASRPDSWHRFGVRRHYRMVPWSDHVEVYWVDGREAYVTPISASEVGVAILWSGEKSGFDRQLSSFPLLATRLRGAEETSRNRGWGPLRQHVGGVVRGPVALVGDAAGYLDAITGEGLSLAFHQAEALASCLAMRDLRPYPRMHRRIGRLADRLTALLLWVERHPRLRRRTIAALARDPALFDHFLAVHTRAQPATSLAPQAPRLLWRLAWP